MSKLKPGATIGPFPYRIVQQLGAGSGNMSEVYLATVGHSTDQERASHVVIKISKALDEHKDFFEDTISNEAERLRKLDHRGVVRILPIQTDHRMRAQAYSARASGLPDNPWFLVLEHLTGNSLADLLHNYKQLDIALTIDIIRKVAQTLEYLHYNDLVHLDLKPENILFRRPLELGGRVEPVLIDFGIARTTGQAGLEGRTLHYAPPERILSNRGNAPPETLPRPAPSMDIYSLGVVFYQMLAGRRPFEGRTPRSISSAILEGKPTHPSKYASLIWPKLDELVMQMLHRDPNQRPTAGELVEQLGHLRAKPPYQDTTVQPGKALKISGQQPRKPFAKVGKVATWLLLLLLLLLGSGAAISYAQTGQIGLPTPAQLHSWPIAVGQRLASLSNALFMAPAEPAARVVVEPTQPPSPTAEQAAAVAPPGVTQTATLTATATVVLPTASPTPTWTPTVTPTPKPPTSTPVPDAPAQVSTATQSAATPVVVAPTATALSTQRPTSTPAPENTVAPTSTPVDTPTAKPTQPPQRTVTLLTPPDGTQGNQTETFSWQSNFTLPKGHEYEVVFWRVNEQPLQDGRGWAGTTSNTTITTNLTKQGAPQETYYWGVLLVQTAPYKRVQYLGGNWQYILTQ